MYMRNLNTCSGCVQMTHNSWRWCINYMYMWTLYLSIKLEILETSNILPCLIMIPNQSVTFNILKWQPPWFSVRFPWSENSVLHCHYTKTKHFFYREWRHSFTCVWQRHAGCITSRWEPENAIQGIYISVW